MSVVVLSKSLSTARSRPTRATRRGAVVMDNIASAASVSREREGQDVGEDDEAERRK